MLFLLCWVIVCLVLFNVLVMLIVMVCWLDDCYGYVSLMYGWVYFVVLVVLLVEVVFKLCFVLWCKVIWVELLLDF